MPATKKINRCPSCEEQLFSVVNEFCRACPKCGRVFEYDYDYDDEQLQEENRRRIFFIANPMTKFHLKNIFRKWNIDKMFLPASSIFLVTLLLSLRG